MVNFSFILSFTLILYLCFFNVSYGKIIYKNPSSASCNGTWWIYHVFGECVQNSVQFSAFLFGLLSILCWFVAQIPQLIKNCISGKADAALSCLFLIQWLGGDLTNLIGAILTQQLPTQIGTAIYFVFMDIILLTQYLFYWFKNRRRNINDDVNTHKQSSRIIYISIIPTIFVTILTLTSLITINSTTNNEQSLVYHGRIILSFSNSQSKVVDINDWKDILGYIFGWVSALLYLGSRLPQIFKNFRRKSVDGLSLPMFLMAVLGNLTYGLGILLYSVDKIFILRKLPWLIGSIGTLCFDFTIFLQFIIFSPKNWISFRNKLRDEDNSANLIDNRINSQYSHLIDNNVKDYQSLQ